MEDTWIREFYNETDPEARLEILNDHKLEDEIGLFMELPGTEKESLRKICLWVILCR